MFDYLKVSAAVPALKLADVETNVSAIVEKIKCAADSGSDLAVFPELSLTGYTVADIFYQKELQNSVLNALEQIAVTTAMVDVAAVVGAPIVIDGQMYNTAVVIEGGKIRGIVPKTFLPNYNECYEKRWFSSADMLSCTSICSFELGADDEYEIPVGRNLVFDIAGAKVGVEIGEDADAPVSNAALLSIGGAEVIVNVSAIGASVSAADFENTLRLQSLRNICAYVNVTAGRNESTTDGVYFGGVTFCENGTELFSLRDRGGDVENVIITKDFDLGKIRNDRCKNTVFVDCKKLYNCIMPTKKVICSKKASTSLGETYNVAKMPFVPSDKVERINRCNKIFYIQSEGLRKRLAVTGAKPVIGISGGLDSTLAVLVAVEAVKRLGRPVSDVVGITMPCFGTTDRTKNNAVKLMEMLGVTSIEISIKEACLQHMADIGQAPDCYDVTFENIQARERTQVLMDYASRVGGLVVGTGDLSELALGWCTYNADHMSMYGVNGGVPKTLVRWMVVSLAERAEFEMCKDILLDISDTPISPELLPPDESGDIAQQTENIVGPYSLHDFFIFYALRYGFEPKKIFHLAVKAFDGDYDKATIHKWLRSFYRRFFTQQFKRNCQPDGVKIGSVGLSPRSDWKMPSDASFDLWIKAVDEIEY